MFVYQILYLSNRLSDRRFQGRRASGVAKPPGSRSNMSRKASQYSVQWIGLRENLQETIDFPIKYGVFLQNVPSTNPLISGCQAERLSLRNHSHIEIIDRGPHCVSLTHKLHAAKAGTIWTHFHAMGRIKEVLAAAD